ncbi:MAG: histidine ammonia-lyase, partial [Myxococcales bacterium]|nr:histidine ammonia-lyase [Myxococcales bacterium]
RAAVERIARDGDRHVYGINTGFGSLKDVAIGSADLARLQRNLLMSHSAGVGEPLPVEVVRAAMLLRANALARGASGVRPVVVETLLAMLARGVHPCIPAQGSVGASGDLAPLSHMALVLSRPPDGEDDPAELSGETIAADGRRVPGKEAMAAADIPRLVLGAKEGLALNNGVQISAALGVLALLDAERLADLADLAVAMTVEAVRGVADAYQPAVHRQRPFAGQAVSAARILAHLAGSSLVGSDPQRIQDGYSLRCAPQVHGAVRDALARVRETLTVEINSATDNPLVLVEPDGAAVVSAGQFHGEPVALAADALKVALAELAGISERRVFRLLTKALSFGLPPLLAPPDRPGLGLMALQFTAAGLVAESKHIAHPSSVDNIPTCEDQEDHVSMSPIAARGARRIVANTAYVLACEMLCASSALALRRDREAANLGAGTARAVALCREPLAWHAAGSPPGRCLEEVCRLIHAGAFDAPLLEAGA